MRLWDRVFMQTVRRLTSRRSAMRIRNGLHRCFGTQESSSRYTGLPPMEDSDYILVRHNEICDNHRGCAVGDHGIQDIGTIIPAARACGTKWLMTELWNEPESLKNAEISIENLKKYL